MRPGSEQGRGEVRKDGHGPNANELVNFAGKKRQVRVSGLFGAHVHTWLSVENEECAQIARCSTSQSIGLAACKTLTVTS